MIDAAEARKLAKEMIGTKVQEQAKNIEKVVVDAAEKGNFYCHIDGHLFPQVSAYLKGLGYNVKYDSARNESWTTINWSDDKC